MKIPQLQQRTRTPSLQTGYVDVQGSGPAAFGAAVGQGLSSLGANLSSIDAELEAKRKAEEEKAKAQEKQMQRFTALRNMSDHEVDLSQKIDEVKKTAAPNGMGYRKNVDELLTKAENDFITTLPLDLQPEFKARYGTLREKQLGAAAAEETRLQTDFYVKGVNDEQNRALVTIKAAPDQYEAVKGRLFEAIDATGLSDVQKADLRRKAETNIASVKYGIEKENNRIAKLNTDPNDSIDALVERMVQVESGGDPNAKAKTSSALGVGQFPNATWLELVAKHAPEIAANKSRDEILAMRTDPQLSRAMLAAYARDNAVGLRRAGFPATPTNLYLSHFLGPTGALRLLRMDGDTPVESAVSAAAIEANQSVFSKNRTVGEVKQWAAKKMGVVTAIDPSISATQGQDGYWRLPGVEYELDGKTRALPVTREYIERTYGALKSIDTGLGFVVTSAGQEVEGSNRTGSYRHDVGADGQARTADIVLTKGGKKVTPAEAPELYRKAAEELAASGFTGIGHYSWGIHVGGGSRAVWGPSKTSSDVDPQFAAAVRRGWARNSDSPIDSVDTDATYALVPYETRVALTQDATKRANSLVADQYKLEMQNLTAQQNALYLGLFDGTKGQADIEKAREDGVLSDYAAVEKATQILKKRDEDAADLRLGQRINGNPSAVIDPTDGKTKKALNALIGKDGLQEVSNMNADYFSSNVVPTARRWGMLPDDVVGALTGMIRSRDPARVKFALESLSALEQAAPAAYRAQVNENVSRSVDRFASLRGTADTNKLINDIIGADSAEVRKSREALEKEGESQLRQLDGKVALSKRMVNDFIESFDSIFTFGPKAPSLPSTLNALERELGAEFVRAYSEVGNVDDAQKLAMKTLSKTWGVTTVGGVKQVMRFPPESQNLPKLDGTIDWVKEQLRQDFGLKPDEVVELHPVPNFAERAAKGLPPAYNAVRFWPDGRAEPLRGPNGENAIEFKLPEIVKKADEENFATRSRIKEIDERLNSDELNIGINIASPAVQREMYDEVRKLKAERELLVKKLPKSGPEVPVSAFDAIFAPVPF